MGIAKYVVFEHMRQLFFGLMDGKIGAVYIKEDGSVLSSKILLSFDDVITCVRARRLGPLSEMILGASDAGGFVRIFKVTTDDAGDIVLSKLVTLEAHLQQSHVTSKEIWSIIFSPDGRFVATGGEDGTTHVYRMIWNEDASKLDLKLLEILEDKFAAVTCLDWKETPQGNVLMVTSGTSDFL
jgi:WD40 repeat protein